MEVSPSATGIKSYFFTTRGFPSAVRDDLDIELYFGRRWFALTGRPFGTVMPISDCTDNAKVLGWTLRPPSPPYRARQAATTPAVLAADARSLLERCGTVRERPSIRGGTIHTLKRCPFTDEEHKGGGPYAIVFTDGGAYFHCDRSSHGPRRQWMAPAGRHMSRRGRLLP